MLDGACLASTMIEARPKPTALSGKVPTVYAMLWVWRTLLVAASEEVRRLTSGTVILLIRRIFMYINTVNYPLCLRFSR